MRKCIFASLFILLLSGCVVKHTSSYPPEIEQFLQEFSAYQEESAAYFKQNKALKLEMDNSIQTYKKNLNDMVNFANSLTDQQTSCWLALLEAQNYAGQNAVADRVAIEKFIDGVGSTKAEEWFRIDNIHHECLRQKEEISLKCEAASAKRQELLHKLEQLIYKTPASMSEQREYYKRRLEIIRLKDELSIIKAQLSNIDSNLSQPNQNP